MKNDFIYFTTKDGLTLPGLLRTSSRSKKVAIYIHGNGNSSIFAPQNNKQQIAQSLQNQGISFLQFNNRGAEYITELPLKGKKGIEVKRFGMSYEKIKDCIYDIDAAVEYLATQGYKEFYLIGESTGANKICVYNFYKSDNVFSKYILLSGGDDTGIYYEILGRSKFNKLLQISKEKIQENKGNEIVKELLTNTKIPCNIFSYEAFYDTINPDGDYNVFPFFEKLHNLQLSRKSLFRQYNSIQKPTLVIYGENDEYTNVLKVIPILQKEKPEFMYEVIKKADHSFSNHQKELSNALVQWIVK